MKLGGFATVTGNTIYDGKQSGVYCYDNGRGILENNLIYNCEFDGVALKGNAETMLQGNEIHSTKRTGIVVYGQGTATIDNNQIWDTGQAGVCFKERSTGVASRNVIHNGKESGIYVYADGSATIEDNEIYDQNFDGCAICSEKPSVLNNNRIHDTKRTGIVVYNKGVATISGNEICRSGQAGICLKLEGNAQVCDNHIHDCKQSGIYVYDKAFGYIENNVIENTTYDGIAIKSKVESTVIKNTIHNTQNHGVLLYENGRAIIESCHMFDITLSCIAVRGESWGRLKTNHLHDLKQHGITVEGKSTAVLEGNDINNVASDAINISSENQVSVHHNNIYDVRCAISISKSASADIEHCDISGVRETAIEIKDSAYATVSENQISEVTLDGVLIANNSTAHVEKNQIHHVGGTGVRIDTMENPLVSRNEIHHTGEQGVVICAKAFGSIEDNDIHDCATSGVELCKGAQGVVSRNHIWGNKGYGVSLKQSSARIERNNIYESEGGVSLDNSNQQTFVTQNLIHQVGQPILVNCDSGSGQIDVAQNEVYDPINTDDLQHKWIQINGDGNQPVVTNNMVHEGKESQQKRPELQKRRSLAALQVDQPEEDFDNFYQIKLDHEELYTEYDPVLDVDPVSWASDAKGKQPIGIGLGDETAGNGNATNGLDSSNGLTISDILQLEVPDLVKTGRAFDDLCRDAMFTFNLGLTGRLETMVEDEKRMEQEMGGEEGPNVDGEEEQSQEVSAGDGHADETESVGSRTPRSMSTRARTESGADIMPGTTRPRLGSRSVEGGGGGAAVTQTFQSHHPHDELPSPESVIVDQTFESCYAAGFAEVWKRNLVSNSRDWNKEYQRILDGEGLDASKLPALRQLQQDFQQLTVEAITTIANEVMEADKSIPVLNLGGVQGGLHFFHRGLLIRMVPTDDLSMKAAANEFKGMMALAQVDNPGIQLPMFAKVDHMGLRFLVTSCPPVGVDTLVYGSSHDGLNVVVGNPVVYATFDQISKTLNLRKHAVAHSDKLLHVNGDIECHVGLDGKPYVFDTARLMPAAFPVRHVPNAHLFQLFRPEFVKTLRVALSSDAFSYWGEHKHAKHNLESFKASKQLEQSVITEYVSSLEEYDVVDLWTMNVSEELHSNGINVRYLGYMYGLTAHPDLASVLLSEVAMRAAKKLLNMQLQHLNLLHVGAEGLSPTVLAQQAIVNFLSLLLTGKQPHVLNFEQRSTAVGAGASSSSSAQESEGDNGGQQQISSDSDASEGEATGKGLKPTYMEYLERSDVVIRMESRDELLGRLCTILQFHFALKMTPNVLLDTANFGYIAGGLVEKFGVELSRDCKAFIKKMEIGFSEVSPSERGKMNLQDEYEFDDESVIRLKPRMEAVDITKRMQTHERLEELILDMDDMDVEEVDDMFEEIYADYANSLNANGKDHDVLLEWAFAIRQHSKKRATSDDVDELELFDEQMESACNKYKLVLEADGDSDLCLNQFGMTLMEWGAAKMHQNREGSAELLAAAKEQFLESHDMGLYNLACFSCITNSLDDAQKWLVKCKKAGRLPTISELKVDPYLDNVRGEDWFAGYLE
eukprot:TRINITY_DN2315_c0_g3_i9.p1 TRINITY_DN2315_c0_g3~~TRINITY_DN2315_c0_g3_i9.p1  ORF type:complete len:1569 (-),score=562.70 TRINITY_DN2315_c0_g3_i9:271-4977(-)